MGLTGLRWRWGKFGNRGSCAGPFHLWVRRSLFFGFWDFILRSPHVPPPWWRLLPPTYPGLPGQTALVEKRRPHEAAFSF
jgi:hypothetical protein